MLKDPLIKIILLLVLAGCIIIFWGLIERGMRKEAIHDKERAQAAQANAEASVVVSVANTRALADHIDRVDATTSVFASDMASIAAAGDAANAALAAATDAATAASDADYDHRRDIICSVCYDAWTAICGPYMSTASPQHPAD